MKKFICFILGLFILGSNNISFKNFNAKTIATISQEDTTDTYELSTFNALEPLIPHITSGISSYYGRNRYIDFENAKVIDFKPLSDDNKYYEVTLQLVTCEPDHKGPYGVDRITLVHEFGNVKIINFIHIATSQKKW